MVPLTTIAEHKQILPLLFILPNCSGKAFGFGIKFHEKKAELTIVIHKKTFIVLKLQNSFLHFLLYAIIFSVYIIHIKMVLLKGGRIGNNALTDNSYLLYTGQGNYQASENHVNSDHEKAFVH